MRLFHVLISATEPSIPIKLSSEPATATDKGALEVLVISYLITAMGIPLASASPGIRGL